MMKKRFVGRAMLLALALSLLLSVCALAEYDSTALSNFAATWNAYLEGTHVKLNAYTSSVYAHQCDYSDKAKYSIKEALQAQSSSVRYSVDYSYSTFEPFHIFYDMLTQAPKTMNIYIDGQLTGSAEDSGSSGSLASFYFDNHELLDALKAVRAGKKVVFSFGTDKGTVKVNVSESETPTLVKVMNLSYDGLRYSDKSSPDYKRASLLPNGAVVTPTPKPSIALPVPSALQGKTFREGDKGSSVLTIKKRMQTLGYFTASAELSNEFNDTMVKRVKEFQKNNWLTQTGEIDAQTLAKLYDSNPAKGSRYVAPTPTPKPEGRITLVLADRSSQYKESGSYNYKWRTPVKNESRSRTIVAFELAYYTQNIWGDRTPSSGYYTVTTEKKIKPGETAFSDYYTLYNVRDIDRLYVAISRVRYSDGTIEEDYSKDYWYWTL